MVLTQAYGTTLYLTYPGLKSQKVGDKETGYYLILPGNCKHPLAVGEEAPADGIDWKVDAASSDQDACRDSCTTKPKCQAYQYVIDGFHAECRQWFGVVNGDIENNPGEECYFKQIYNPFNLLDWSLQLREIGIREKSQVHLTSRFEIDFLKETNLEPMVMYFENSKTVLEMKKILQVTLQEEDPEEKALGLKDMRFVFEDKDLEDDKTLIFYEIGIEKEVFGMKQESSHIIQKANPNLECKTECIDHQDQDFYYCVKQSDFDIPGAGECCSESSCLNRYNGFCSQSTKDEDFKTIMCPTQGLKTCGRDKVIEPKRGTQGTIKHLSFEKGEAQYDFCSYIVKPPDDMLSNDILWVNFMKIENADVILYYGDKRKFDFIEYDSMHKSVMIQGMSKQVDHHENIYVVVKAQDNNLRANVIFDAVVEIGPVNNWQEQYKTIIDKMPITQNVTDHNIDSMCNQDNIWKDDEGVSKKEFTDLFTSRCVGKNNCVLKPEEMTLYYKVKDFCRDRIKYLNITSYDFITVVGCTKDTVYVPLLDQEVHKQRIAIFVVAMDLLSVVVMVFVFGKLIIINNKYIKIVDDLSVQMKDFGIKINNMQVDKYTQDYRVQKMKTWMHFSDILMEYHINDESRDAMEVLDVSLSQYSQSQLSLIKLMQDVQEAINDHYDKITVNNYGDNSKQKREEESKITEHKKFQRALEEKYNKMNQKVDQFTVNTQKIPKSKRQEEIQYVFIVFKNCQTEAEIREHIFPKQSLIQVILMNIFCIKHYKPKRNKGLLFGKELDIEEILEPDEIIWNNLEVTGSNYTLRQVATVVITLVLIVITTICSFGANGLAQLIDQEFPMRTCDSTIDKLDAYYDEKLSAKKTNLMQCYCTQAVSPFDFGPAYSHNFADSQAQLKTKGIIPMDAPVDSWNYCMIFWVQKYVQAFLSEVLDESAVIFNELIAVGFKSFSKFQRAHTEIVLQATQFQLIFLMEFINMGLIELMAGFDHWKVTDYLMLGSIKEQQIFQDYSTEWYSEIGSEICMLIFSSIILNNFINVFSYLWKSCRRILDRGCSNQMKVDPDDEEDDRPNSKIKIQSDLEELYSGSEFEGEMSFSRMNSTLFVILLYCSGMPFLYVVGAVFFMITYFLEKFFILFYYERSQTIKRVVPEIAQSTLKIGIMIHMINACFMLSSPDIFKVQVPDQDVLKYSYSKADFERWRTQLSSVNQPKHKENDFIDNFYGRFSLIHQQLYLFVLLVFFLLFFAANSIYLFTFYLVFGFFKWSVSIYQIFKDVVTFIYKFQMKGFGYFLADDQENFEDIEGDSDQIVIRNETQLEEQELERQKLVKQRQMLQQRLENKKNRPDYAPNILYEFNCINLSNFWERANRELNDFRDLFNLEPHEKSTSTIEEISQKEDEDKVIETIGETVSNLSKMNKNQAAEFKQRETFAMKHKRREVRQKMRMNQVFNEICYLHRMKPDEVLKYETFLIQRIFEIEEVVNSHFNLLDKVFIDKKEKEFQKRHQRELEHGIQKSLSKKVQQKKDEKKELAQFLKQLRDPEVYKIKKKLKLLIQFQDEMIIADKARKENRKCIQEYCRMTGSLSQSYFILDSQPFKIGRKIYYNLGQKEQRYANEDEDFIKQLVEKEDDSDADQSENDGLLLDNKNNKPNNRIIIKKKKSNPLTPISSAKTIPSARITIPEKKNGIESK